MATTTEQTDKPRTIKIGNTDVLIDPQTGGPMPGSIIDGHHKVPWTESDIRRKYGSVTWYNHTEATSCTVHGVKFNFASGDEVTTPTIVKDIIMEAYKNQRGKDNFVRRTGGNVTVGPLEPRDF